MIQSGTIIKALPNVLKNVDIPGLGEKVQGKVRDIYVQGDKRFLVVTDRQSAFNYNIGFVPYKGTVLNLLAAFWFKKTKDIIPNFLISVPDDNVTVGYNCEPLQVEMIVRGYLSGSTVTSVWTSYEKGERMIYGLKFPDGMKKNQKLPEPIITPTTHPLAGSGSHNDERLTRDEIIKGKIIPKKIYEQMEETALALFDYGSKWCKKQGLILVDTKYEFGLYKGNLILIDEIHTPDSSRFWIADSYQERLMKGIEPEYFDKEFLRLWYKSKGYKGIGQPKEMEKELIVKLAQRYIGVYEILTGKKFKAYKYPIEDRIRNNLKNYL